MRVCGYDTTLRAGTKGEHSSFSVTDELAIVCKLDDLGIDYIDGGWSGSNSRDAPSPKRPATFGVYWTETSPAAATSSPSLRKGT